MTRIEPITGQHIVFVEASTTGAGELAHRLAHSAGLRVTLLCRNPRAYQEALFTCVDAVVQCETNDAAVVLRVILELLNQWPVHGITTTADFYVPQAAYAARELGLTGLDYQVALSVRNKYRMRLKLEQQCRELNPRFLLVSSTREALSAAAEWRFPFVAKPQNLNDGQDVQLIRSSDELLCYMAGAEQWNTNSADQIVPRGVLLEEFVDGPEFSVETLQAKGHPLQLIGVTKKYLTGFERGRFVEIGHSFPTRIEGVERIVAAALRALEALEIDCGVIHTECRLCGGEPKIMEVNPRLAGGGIGSHMIELATGRNPTRAVIEIALGQEVIWKIDREKGAALHSVWSEKRGVFRGIANEREIRQMPGVVEILPRAPRGRVAKQPESNADLLATVLAQGETADLAFSNATAAAHRVRLILEPST
ncbi:MAG: hypothetical protein QOF89_5856 [Acidobacteriota bacterium]|nr:hypothetical protein [Acidobacteriota bacterium]